MDGEPTPRLGLQSLLAGPAVVFFWLAAEWSTRFTNPIILGGQDAFQLFVFLLVAAVIGFFPALAANAIGTLLLIKLGNVFPLLRFPFLWALIGGLGAWGVVRGFEFSPEWTFAYTAAGALSAFICRARLA